MTVHKSHADRGPSDTQDRTTETDPPVEIPSTLTVSPIVGNGQRSEFRRRVPYSIHAPCQPMSLNSAIIRCNV